MFREALLREHARQGSGSVVFSVCNHAALRSIRTRHSYRTQVIDIPRIDDVRHSYRTQVIDIPRIDDVRHSYRTQVKDIPRIHEVRHSYRTQVKDIPSIGEVRPRYKKWKYGLTSRMRRCRFYKTLPVHYQSYLFADERHINVFSLCVHFNQLQQRMYMYVYVHLTYVHFLHHMCT